MGAESPEEQNNLELKDRLKSLIAKMEKTNEEMQGKFLASFGIDDTKALVLMPSLEYPGTDKGANDVLVVTIDGIKRLDLTNVDDPKAAYNIVLQTIRSRQSGIDIEEFKNNGYVQQSGIRFGLKAGLADEKGMELIPTNPQAVVTRVLNLKSGEWKVTSWRTTRGFVDGKTAELVLKPEVGSSFISQKVDIAKDSANKIIAEEAALAKQNELDKQSQLDAVQALEGLLG